MAFWSAKRVMVTGGAGFLGSPIVEKLRLAGADVHVPRKRDYDLTNLEAALRAFAEIRPQIVVHCAAFYGGIWLNKLYPGRIYYENLVMGANVFEAARRSGGVEKVTTIGTACSYPGYLDGYLSEERFWDGPLHESVMNYGVTKKILAIQGRAYKDEYDLDSIHLVLTNLYGPGDTFNPDRSHVVSALIRKFVEARQADANEVVVWGTGKPVREFLFVEDCAEAIVRATENHNDLDPLNIGTGTGTSIRELAETIKEVVEFRGQMRWDTAKPDGTAKKVLNVSKMKTTLRWQPPTSLREGLEKTIAWYVDNKESADQRL